MPSTHFSISFPSGLPALIVAVALGACGAPPEPPDTPEADVSRRVSVSGISAGGYMAVQLHLALADRIGGAAVLAAGPYHCAEGSLRTALSRCLAGDGMDVAPLLEVVAARAADGALAPLEALRDDRVWLFRGSKDGVVNAPTAAALSAFYATLLAPDQLAEVYDVAAGHGWPTLATGGACQETGGDYLNACDYDAAGALLTHLYGPLSPRTDAAPVETIDITAHAVAGSDIAGEALAFVPPACRSATGECRLHIALHGCGQGAEFVEARFANGNGLNDWAAANRIVVLYPQVEKSLTNPQGCWDWWGYTGEDYDTRAGKQIRTIAALIDAWAAPAPSATRPDPAP